MKKSHHPKYFKPFRMARFIKRAMTVIKILACAIMFKAFFASFADETQGCQAEVQTIEEKKSLSGALVSHQGYSVRLKILN